MYSMLLTFTDGAPSHRRQAVPAAHLINAQKFVQLRCHLHNQQIGAQWELHGGHKVYTCVNRRCDVSRWQQLATQQAASVQSTATWQMT